MLTKIEKSIVQEFVNLKIPAIYKFDNTLNILYIEHVLFDICPFLLKNKKREIDICAEKDAYSNFLAQIVISGFDEEAKRHFNLLRSVMIILFKYYS